ncbi:MAG TPA: Na+/H+ antiporter NhaA [Longimicrobiaceae bacterium]|nr:Na+/H+ antiporter NhaA [Longimicrobiaceae bacterium]
MSTEPKPETDEGLRVPWSRSQGAVARRLLQPLQSFLEAEASSAVLLLSAAVLAIAWANSPWSVAYEDLWGTVLTFRVGDWVVREDLRHFVNDGLMALFFLVVGLEIKREFLTGELRDRRAAALPVVAALGGMVVPALIYLALNPGGEAAKGWGIPMATDIAFALGVLTLAARSAPASLKPFLLTLAIVDDIGAIVVIAFFYSGGVAMGPLLAAAVLIGAILVLQRLDVRSAVVYVALGVGVWLAFHESGVHPTIAGVILGLLTPAEPFQRPRAVSAEAARTAATTVDDPEPPDADSPQWLRLAMLSREAVSPLARAEAALHPWTSYAVIPLFALANAGVRLSADAFRDAMTSPVTLGVVLGLVAGKILGITLASALAVRTGLGRLPSECGWRHVVGVSAVAGVGFTVSLFIAELAFEDPALAVEAKVGIFAASLIAGVIGFTVLRSGRVAAPAEPSSPGNVSAGPGG